jgi:hypothetical protein
MHKQIPFCSDSHEKKYQAETQRLMISRLAETAARYAKYRHSELRAHSTPTGLSPDARIRPLEQSTAEC